MNGMDRQTGVARNLDVFCAELGKMLAEIPNMRKKTINAALSVLEEQGPFALFLYVKAEEKDLTDPFINACTNFVCRHVFEMSVEKLVDEKSADKDQDISFAIMKKLSGDLDNLFFAKDLLRQSLIYAKYFLKVEGEKE